jgi:hypothetical protein
MSQRVGTNRGRQLPAVVVVLGCVGGALAFGVAAVPAAEETKLGRCVAVTGALLQRDDAEKTWKLVKPRDAITAGTLLLALPGSKAEIEAGGGSGRLVLAGNLPQMSLLPLLESAVVLRSPAKGVDIDFSLERGRVIVANKKGKGALKVRVRFQDQRWDLTLSRPGAEAALEFVTLWVDRPSSVEKPKKTEKPMASALLFALKGEVTVQTETSEFLLRAPPGPALFQWRSGRGASGPMRLKELPPWAKADAARTPAAKAAQARVEKVGLALEKTSVSDALAEALQSKDTLTRGLAVYCLGAIDNLPAVVAGLENKSQRDVRLAAIDELRHWLGRHPENLATLFKALRDKGYSAAHARIALQLLHPLPFSTQQLARPETYELLIDYLVHQRLAIRELAFWHLIRLAPEEGSKITYDPAADASKLEAAHAKWKKALPDGQLPRKPKPGPMKKE